jgi:hypothetical protein
MKRRRSLCLMIAAAQGFAIVPGRADMGPKLYTNEAYVEEVTRRTALDIADPLAVFGFVLNSLPDRVTVYPTENYYYFTFIYQGVPYAGNIRLDASDRDQGKVSFGYYEDTAPWKRQAPMTFRVLDAADGVKLEKLDRFLYRLTYGQKSVVFALNDLSQVRPPAAVMGSDETFIGPVFDESGIRFFLIYNAKLKLFHFILDETVPVADGLFAARRTDRILIGRRTGFAFYRDHRLNRKILIGVFLGNVELNNYLDGPFDQLPDNFIEGEGLRQALIQVDPTLRGQIDRFGAWPGGDRRYMIAPYFMYRKVSDLDFIHQCAISKRTPAAEYHACFAMEGALVQHHAARGPPRR